MTSNQNIKSASAKTQIGISLKEYEVRDVDRCSPSDMSKPL